MTIPALPQCPRNPHELMLATTTSLQDSGLLNVLIPLFEQLSGYQVHTIAVGSGAAMGLGERGEADVVLVHAPVTEHAFTAAADGINRQCVMYNDFVLLAPPSDPAGVRGMPAILDAFRTIAAAETAFLSRGDNSGTDQLEKKLWQTLGVMPQQHGWYMEADAGMGETLQLANQRAAYTLSDRATYVVRRPQLAFLLAVAGGRDLLNVYHVIAINPQHFPHVNNAAAQAFTAFLVTAETQQVIGSFGQDTVGEALFTPCARNHDHGPNLDG